MSTVDGAPMLPQRFAICRSVERDEADGRQKAKKVHVSSP